MRPALMWAIVLAWLVVAVGFLSASRGRSFQSPDILVHLYPITSDLPASIPEAIRSKWLFSLLEKRDLEAAAELSNVCFYQPRVVLDTTGAGELELKFLTWLKNLYERVDRSDSFNGNYLGYLSRSGRRLDRPTLAATTDSFILVATPRMVQGTTGQIDDIYSQNAGGLGSPPGAPGSGIVGMVEICLEKADGKLAPPIQLPWKGRLAGDEQPYLCNLCVEPAARRTGLGSLLVRVAEQLVVHHWQKRRMFLHVEHKNLPAQRLYAKMDYRVVTGLPAARADTGAAAFTFEESAGGGEGEGEGGEYGRRFKITSYDDIYYYSKELQAGWQE